MLPEVHLVAAARPNLPKLAALWHALTTGPDFCKPVLLHTGQHEDPAMFGVHFADLGLPTPDIALGVSGGSHAVLTGRSMIACETVWKSRRPAAVVVAGDVDGSLAAALAARKLGIMVIHLEAGLRSGERGLPEEINRRAIDAISDILWGRMRGPPRGYVRKAMWLRRCAQWAMPWWIRKCGICRQRARGVCRAVFRAVGMGW
jgi:UDP-N-acetylglucosamine 2-epimerase (non-hydrolysing)